MYDSFPFLNHRLLYQQLVEHGEVQTAEGKDVEAFRLTPDAKRDVFYNMNSVYEDVQEFLVKLEQQIQEKTTWWDTFSKIGDKKLTASEADNIRQLVIQEASNYFVNTLKPKLDAIAAKHEPEGVGVMIDYELKHNPEAGKIIPELKAHLREKLNEYIQNALQGKISKYFARIDQVPSR